MNFPPAYQFAIDFAAFVRRHNYELKDAAELCYLQAEASDSNAEPESMTKFHKKAAEMGLRVIWPDDFAPHVTDKDGYKVSVPVFEIEWEQDNTN